MVRWWYLLIVVLVGSSMAHAEGASSPSSASASSMPARERRIVSACADPSGNIAVLVAESSPTATSAYTLSYLDSCGKGTAAYDVTEICTIACKPKIMQWMGKAVMAYAMSGKGICTAAGGQGDLKVETILNIEEGILLDFWVVRVGGKPEVIVRLSRDVDPDGRMAFPPLREYMWLYRYRQSEQGWRMEGKTCLDDNACRVVDTECAASKNGVYIWQNVVPLGEPKDIERVRVGNWVEGPKISWIEKYSGMWMLGTAVSPEEGSRAVVDEWKSPATGAGIVVGLSVHEPRVVPLCGYSAIMSPCGVAYVRSSDSMYIAVREPERMRCVRWCGTDGGVTVNDVKVSRKDSTVILIVQEKPVLLKLHDGKFVMESIGAVGK